LAFREANVLDLERATRSSDDVRTSTSIPTRNFNALQSLGRRFSEGLPRRLRKGADLAEAKLYRDIRDVVARD